MTIAVDDSASAQPMTSPAERVRPNAKIAIAPSAAAQAPICSAPRPNTSARKRFRRSNDNSRPIMNSRNTTPSSASAETSSLFSIRNGASHGSRVTNAPTPQGPMATPASRKPMIGEIRSRRNSGTITPAVVRNSKAPLNSAKGRVELTARPVGGWSTVAPLSHRIAFFFTPTGAMSCVGLRRPARRDNARQGRALFTQRADFAAAVQCTLTVSS